MKWTHGLIDSHSPPGGFTSYHVRMDRRNEAVFANLFGTVISTGSAGQARVLQPGLRSIILVSDTDTMVMEGAWLSRSMHVHPRQCCGNHLQD